MSSHTAGLLSYTVKERSIIWEFLSDEFNNSELPLFLLGDGGSGKTSVISWLTYLYNCDINNENDERYKPEDKTMIFRNRKLIVIRCRLLDVRLIEGNNGNLYNSICKYLGIDPDNIEYFGDKYIILDGFDELCIAEKINWKEKLDALLKTSITDSKLIITSRPSVIIPNYNLGMYYSIISYRRSEKRRWLDYYKKCTGESVDKKTESCILSSNENDIFIYPQLLYMVAGQKEDSSWSINNKWSLWIKMEKLQYMR